MDRFLFPRWVNKFVPLMLGAILVGAAYGGSVLFVTSSPQILNRGYRPEQPVPFSHKLHAGRLKMDCRYCHNTVEKASHAAVPPTATCGNCHSGQDSSGATQYAAVHANSVALEPVRESLATGESIDWMRVHNLPDFVYFNHSAHVTQGVSCVECHGRVDKMDVVEVVEPISMAWCLDCHRNPDAKIRPANEVTNLAWGTEAGGNKLSVEEKRLIGQQLREELNINPSTNCSTCHR
ncbi:cytochrome c3 family protein [Bremerella sp. T1]|uniref:cytochrome c3 family protein n=1 Tax=Bremerella sp. TYQ1 TaxID=3119568 RepID=UPI001CCA755E|nr:cytochrome c3 family protein [Bremerella volcania]UBM36003.1 cytochrome c family protein [Bremerella volcania]